MKRSHAKAQAAPQKKARITTRAVETVVHPKRLRRLLDRECKGEVVAYWMSRDQRMADNWALVYAQNICEREEKDMVCFLAIFSH